MKANKRRFFLKHSKSSAAVIAISLHALFIIGGLSLVVMNHIIPEEVVFYPTEYAKPKPLPRLRPPSNARNPKVTKPRFERIPVEVKYEQKMPDISLPDMAGAQGEFGGAAGAAMSSVSTIGFIMPELDIFNLKTKGEKIFLILDAGPHMLEDRMGGIPAYTIIKQELIRIVDELPPTAVFNICVFANGQSVTLFSNLVKATDSNVWKAEAWLMPLNGVKESVESGRYGIQTIGAGGTRQQQDLRVGPFAERGGNGAPPYRQDRWFRPAMLAMQQGADTVFLLTNTWGHHRIVSKGRNQSLEEWHKTSEGKRWLKHVELAKEKLAEENRQRKANGQPPKVIAHGRWGLMRAYYPDIKHPPLPEYHHFSPEEFEEAFELVRAEHRETQVRSGLNRKDRYSFNVVQFVPADAGQSRDERFYKLTKLTRGGYATIAGLEAIQSYVKGERK